MSLGDSTIFGMMHDRMDWLSQRQRVLSQNIANANTPGYHARDLQKLDFNDTLQRQNVTVGLKVTNPRHVALPESGNRFREGNSATSYETSIDQNSVVLEEQMIKVNQTASDFTLATNIYRKYIALHKAALGRSGGQG